MYWDERFPVIISTESIHKLAFNNELRLMAISDITCDFAGSIQFMTKFTTIDEPFFVYNAKEKKINDR